MSAEAFQGSFPQIESKEDNIRRANTMMPQVSVADLLSIFGSDSDIHNVSLETLKAMIQSRAADLPRLVDSNGASLLMLAFQGGFTELISDLLKANSSWNLEESDTENRTLVHWGCFHVDFVAMAQLWMQGKQIPPLMMKRDNQGNLPSTYFKQNCKFLGASECKSWWNLFKSCPESQTRGLLGFLQTLPGKPRGYTPAYCKAGRQCLPPEPDAVFSITTIRKNRHRSQ